MTHSCPGRQSHSHEIVSIIDRSFFHKFINPPEVEKRTQYRTQSRTRLESAESGRDRKWKVEWNNFDQQIFLFESIHAVEARSLDRGFRINQNDINNSL